MHPPGGRRSGNSKTLERQQSQRGLRPRQTWRLLPLRRAINAGVDPPRVSASGRDTFAPRPASRTHALQRHLLPMTDPRFDLPLRSGSPRRHGHSDNAVMAEHLARQRIQGEIVDTGREHALITVVEHNDANRTAQPTKPAARAAPPMSAHLTATRADESSCASPSESRRTAAWGQYSRPWVPERCIRHVIVVRRGLWL